MMCNYNGLACQEYLRGVTSFTEVRSEGVRFARDSLLEGDGFEPSVPGEKPWVPSGKHFADSCWQAIRLSYSRMFAGADGPASVFVDIIGLPFTPLSFAGVARRTARRAYWYGAATAGAAAAYGYPYYRPPPYYGPPL